MAEDLLTLWRPCEGTTGTAVQGRRLLHSVFYVEERLQVSCENQAARLFFFCTAGTPPQQSLAHGLAIS